MTFEPAIASLKDVKNLLNEVTSATIRYPVRPTFLAFFSLYACNFYYFCCIICIRYILSEGHKFIAVFMLFCYSVFTFIE